MLLCQNDRHRNPVSLIQYSEVVLVVGYIMLGTLAAFGLVSALWVLYGFLLPAERGGGLYAPARPGVTEDSFARRYLWLRELGLLREELTMVDFGISNAPMFVEDDIMNRLGTVSAHAEEVDDEQEFEKFDEFVHTLSPDDF